MHSKETTAECAEQGQNPVKFSQIIQKPSPQPGTAQQVWSGEECRERDKVEDLWEVEVCGVVGLIAHDNRAVPRKESEEHEREENVGPERWEAEEQAGEEGGEGS